MTKNQRLFFSLIIIRTTLLMANFSGELLNHREQIMRKYETTYIIDGSLEQDKIDGITQRVREIISNSGGTIIEEKFWLKRRLAYEIQKRQYGHYVILNFEAKGGVVEEMERFFRLNQFVLRYLSLVLSERDLKNIALDSERKKREEEKALQLSQTVNKSEE